MLKIQNTSSSELADAELMQGVASGDMGSFATLIRRHQEHARTLAYRITGAADAADDIAQEAFLRVLKSARRYSPTAAFTTYLHRIIVNLCLDRAKRPKLAALQEGHADARANPEERLAREKRVVAIRREIDALPERQRIALVFHRFQGLTHAQIAESTGWSESAVEALLVRAYAQLRDRLRRWRT